MHLGLKLQSKSDKIECFIDASLGTSDAEGRSTSELILFLFGDPIVWRTKKQSYISLSSTEAEYIAMSLASKELVSIREMFKRLLKIENIPILYEDNTAAIKIAKSDDSQSVKHIVNLCFHYVKLEVENKKLIIKWILTQNQIADMLTKALDRHKLEKFRNELLENLSH